MTNLKKNNIDAENKISENQLIENLNKKIDSFTKQASEIKKSLAESQKLEIHLEKKSKDITDSIKNLNIYKDAIELESKKQRLDLLEIQNVYSDLYWYKNLLNVLTFANMLFFIFNFVNFFRG